MLGLLKKDYFVLKSQKIFVLLGIMALISLFVGYKNPIFGVATISLVAIFLPIIAMGSDKTGKNLDFLLTLPITWKKYVAEKYFLAIGSSIFSATIFSAILLLVQYLVLGANNLHFFLLQCMILSLVISILLSIIIPMNFKFGVESARFVIIIMVLAISFLVSALAERISGIFDNPAINFIVEMNFGMKVVFLIVVNVAILFLSFQISVKIFSKKEI